MKHIKILTFICLFYVGYNASDLLTDVYVRFYYATMQSGNMLAGFLLQGIWDAIRLIESYSNFSANICILAIVILAIIRIVKR